MKLLTAVDLTSQSERVVREAALWAKRLGATVDLLYVDDMPDAAVFLGDPQVRAIVVEERERLMSKHKDRIQELLETLPETYQGKAECVPGIPADVLIERAGDYDAVLVSTHGRTGLRHLWLGSVAEKVVRFSPAPVIVTRLGPDED